MYSIISRMRVHACSQAREARRGLSRVMAAHLIEAAKTIIKSKRNRFNGTHCHK